MKETFHRCTSTGDTLANSYLCHALKTKGKQADESTESTEIYKISMILSVIFAPNALDLLNQLLLRCTITYLKL